MSLSLSLFLRHCIFLNHVWFFFLFRRVFARFFFLLELPSTHSLLWKVCFLSAIGKNRCFTHILHFQLKIPKKTFPRKKMALWLSGHYFFQLLQTWLVRTALLLLRVGDGTLFFVVAELMILLSNIPELSVENHMSQSPSYLFSMLLNRVYFFQMLQHRRYFKFWHTVYMGWVSLIGVTTETPLKVAGHFPKMSCLHTRRSSKRQIDHANCK